MRRVVEGKGQRLLAAPLAHQGDVPARGKRLAAERDVLGKGRDADAERKAHRRVGLDAEGRAVAEGILGLAGDRHADAADRRLQGSGQQEGNVDAACAAQEGVQRQLRPALVEVGRAAAEVRFKSEEMRARAVGAEEGFPGKYLAGDLVCLLVILVRPHVVRDGGGQSVERRLFQPIRPDALAGQHVEHLAGVHQLHHAAKLGAAVGVNAGQAFVAGDRADRRAVVLRQQLPVGLGVVVGGDFAEHTGGHGLVFQHHAEVDRMGVHRPLVQGTLPRFGILAVVLALVLQQLCQLAQPFLRLAVVEERKRDHAFIPAELAPLGKGDAPALQFLIEALHRAVQPIKRAGVARAFGKLAVERQHLADEKECPNVVACAFLILAGADPSVRLLPLQNGVDVFVGARDQIRIVQQVGERDEAVQPVRHALPALAAAADPCAVAHVGPDLVEIAGKTGCLDFQLAAEPAFRFYFTKIKMLIHGNLLFGFFRVLLGFRHHLTTVGGIGQCTNVRKTLQKLRKVKSIPLKTRRITAKMGI